MRVPNINTYYTATFRLGNLTEDLKNANEVISTQKRINEISDDPLGLSQVLSLRNSIGNLEQIEQNVIMGKSWLEGGESALGNVNNLILDAKSEVSRLASDSSTADERQDAVARIDHIINQIVSLGNTQINGNYIFGGTKTDVIPLVYDKSGETEQVIYKGNKTPFEIRTDKNSGVQVGRNGKTTFWDSDIEINTTNNTIVFKEDNGHGSASEIIMQAVIPDGLYTKDDMEIAVRNALNAASQEHGYGVTYAVDYDEQAQRFSIREDGSYSGYIKTEFMWETGRQAYINNVQASGQIDPDDVTVSAVNADALTIGTEDGKPFHLQWNKLEKNWEIQNNPGYVMPGSVNGTATGVDIDLDEDGMADLVIRLDMPARDKDSIQFEIFPAPGDHGTGHEIGFTGTDSIQAPPVSDTRSQSVTNLIFFEGVNDIIAFEEVDSAGVATTLTADLTNSTSGADYTDMGVLARAIETEMETQSTASGNGIDYAVSYNPETSRFNIRENGASLNELNILWDASTASAATTLGFYPLTDTIDYPHSAITIDSRNNILDFQEENPPGTFATLQARIPTGTYSDMSALAAAVETAMDNVSASSGNTVEYSVSYDQGSDEFDIQRSGGTGLTSFNLLWQTGNGADFSIGEALGYDTSGDDVGGGLGIPYSSDAPPMRMSLFSTTVEETGQMLDFEEINTSGTATTLQAEIEAGTYNSVSDMQKAVEKAMNIASVKSGNSVVYDVSYDEAANRFEIQRDGGTALNGLNLLWASGPNAGTNMAGTLGYSTDTDDTGSGILGAYTGDTDPVWMSFDASNNRIDFQEIRIDGSVSEEMSVEIPLKDYTNPDQVASEIQSAMRNASSNGVAYRVVYDSELGFMIKGSSESIKGFDLLWDTGDHASAGAAKKLGFDPGADMRVSYAESDQDVVNIDIHPDKNNNKLDFKEILSGDGAENVSQLTAVIAEKVYTSHSELAGEIEKAMEKESRKNGNAIDYSVTFDTVTKKFSIKESGTELEQLQLLWHSGDNAPLSQGGSGQSIGGIIGFDGTSDDIAAPLESSREVEWGIFDTLLDLKQYLLNNDRDGIERTIGRLELNFDNMTSRIVDTGMKYSRLEVRQTITNQVNLSLTERRSMIEDADIIESVMKLKNIETAYQAALGATSRVLNLSLVDYLR
jgi:flagellar hook-associated protein 3